MMREYRLEEYDIESFNGHTTLFSLPILARGKILQENWISLLFDIDDPYTACTFPLGNMNITNAAVPENPVISISPRGDDAIL